MSFFLRYVGQTVGILFTITMSVWTSYKLSNKLPQLFGLVLLCVGYFNSFLISEPVCVFLQLSYLTGSVLVSKFLTLCEYTVQGVSLAYSFFKILYEDSLIFIKDAAEKITFVGLLLKDLYLFLENGVVLAASFGWDLLKVAQDVLEVISNFGRLLQLTFTVVKDGLHLVGSTIWHALTSAPDAILHHMKDTVDLIVNTIDVAIDSVFLFRNQLIFNIENLYSFLFDIPLDSIYGLIIGGVLLTVFCIKFKDICCMLASGLVKLYKCMISLCVSLWTGKFLERRSERNYHNGEDDDMLCVVCQCQYKEIIIFPCKHLCLCWDCSVELVKTQHTCPICRTQIRDTMKVYL